MCACVCACARKVEIRRLNEPGEQNSPTAVAAATATATALKTHWSERMEHGAWSMEPSACVPVVWPRLVVKVCYWLSLFTCRHTSVCVCSALRPSVPFCGCHRIRYSRCRHFRFLLRHTHAPTVGIWEGFMWLVGQALVGACLLLLLLLDPTRVCTRNVNKRLYYNSKARNYSFPFERVSTVARPDSSSAKQSLREFKTVPAASLSLCLSRTCKCMCNYNNWNYSNWSCVCVRAVPDRPYDWYMSMTSLLAPDAHMPHFMWHPRLQLHMQLIFCSKSNWNYGSAAQKPTTKWVHSNVPRWTRCRRWADGFRLCDKLILELSAQLLLLLRLLMLF